MSGDGASHPTWDADNHGMLYRDEEKKMLVHTKDFGVSRSALVSHPGVSDLMFPDATPDGAKVIFSSMVKGESTISMVNKNGSNLTVFSKGYMPSWHPNGEDVVFQDQADNDHTQIFILSTRTGQVTQVTNHPSNNMQPTWSPDGQWIAFNSDRSESEFGSRQKAPHLYAIQPNGTNMVQLTKGTAVSLSRPTWSSTGDIYFVSTSGTHKFYRPDIDPVDIWKIRPILMIDKDNDGIIDYYDDCPETKAGDLVDKKGCSIDSDSDGVNESVDKCPDTVHGIAVDAMGCPLDTDNDGIADHNDKCSDTPSGVSVDAGGCPVDADNDGIADHNDKCSDTPSGVSVDTGGCPVDADNDGVADFQDSCPGSIAGTIVNESGCERDPDGDGVIGEHDLCPNTKKGQRIDETGCAALVVRFGFNGSKVDKTNEAILDEVVERLSKHQNLRLEIQGYTDNVGPVLYNKWLSEKRANKVLGLLAKKGIVLDRMKAVGFGPLSPVADNGKKEGQLLNRRVELKFTR